METIINKDKKNKTNLIVSFIIHKFRELFVKFFIIYQSTTPLANDSVGIYNLTYHSMISTL